MKSKKTNIPLHILMLFFALFILSNTNAQCDAQQVARISKKNVEKPYLYSNSDYKQITMDPNNEKIINLEFVAFKDVKYKLIICSSSFDQKIGVTVFSKDKTGKEKDKVYDNAQNTDNNIWTFEPTKQGKYTIRYTIPKSSTGEEKDACMIMIVAFNNE